MLAQTTLQDQIFQTSKTKRYGQKFANLDSKAKEVYNKAFEDYQKHKGLENNFVSEDTKISIIEFDVEFGVEFALINDQVEDRTAKLLRLPPSRLRWRWDAPSTRKPITLIQDVLTVIHKLTYINDPHELLQNFDHLDYMIKQLLIATKFSEDEIQRNNREADRLYFSL